MEQKICFNKRVGYLTLFGFVIFILIGLLNQLTQQRTSTNSRAQTIALSPVPVAPTIAPQCNKPGSVIVRDKENILWSWASKKTINPENGNTLCSSTILDVTPAPSITPILHPIEAKSTDYTEFFTLKNSNNREYCYKYGVYISPKDNITNITIGNMIVKLNSVIDMGREASDVNNKKLVNVPSQLVGEIVDQISQCTMNDGHLCQTSSSKWEWINGDCWHLVHSKYKKNSIKDASRLNQCTSTLIIDPKSDPNCSAIKKGS